MAEKIDIKKTLKFEPLTSQMIIEAADLEKGLNRALSPLIKGYRGSLLRIQKRQLPDGTVIQFPMFDIAIDKFSEGVNKEANRKLAYVMGSKSAFELKPATRDVLRNFVIEDDELVPRERRKSIIVTLNFFKCLQQIFEDNEDYRIKYEYVGYDKQRFNPDIKRYVTLTRFEAPMRAEIEKFQRRQSNQNNKFSLNDYIGDDDYDDDYDSDDGESGFNNQI